ncbi:MAG: poly-gamma-glutamate system protein [Polyangiaceae bacterium]|nr:poly-gamma-glutamate system protein [Polyangiaceae bacterium]
MKRIYWRPPRVSRAALALIAIVAVTAMAAVEAFPARIQQPWHAEKLRAAQLAQDAFDVIKTEKTRRGIPIDPDTDPLATGMIGVAMSRVTSNSGVLTAKQLSINPNFAALLVHYLRQVDVQPGDLVAVGASGSFPALNVATFAAIDAMGLEAIVITSSSASQFGANDPELTWLDMERVLVEARIFHVRSIAASLGGIDDVGIGLSDEGRDLLRAAIARNHIAPLSSGSLAASIDARMLTYERAARGRPIRAYVNVGGGSASVGTHVGKKLFRPGLNRYPPLGAAQVDSVMLRFGERGVPVVHLTNIEGLARKHGLLPHGGKPPRVGEGAVFVSVEYNRPLAALGLALVLAAMFAFVRYGIGATILRGVQRDREAPRQPEPMV